MPVTEPVPTPIVATVTSLLNHVPPVGLPVSVVVTPAQMFVVPPIADGVILTVAVAVTIQPEPSE
jgi:hypothetical protein